MALDRRLCVAPMMDWTDRHCRSFHRLLAPQALLYTEMVTTGALLHGNRRRLLDFDPAEQPVALQLGGSEPDELAACARLGEAWGYVEINLNCGCPSERVQRGAFGACLMREPGLVAECVAAMRAATSLPVTVKCRIGVDDSDEWAFFAAFVDTVAAAGIDALIVHARKAWLKGLSPKENREIPPLRHDIVHRLKAERPGLCVILNGGLTTPAQVSEALAWADGVMVGRAAYQEPWTLHAMARALDPALPPLEREAIVDAMRDYLVRAMAAGVPAKAVLRHMLGLCNGLPGARAWRRTLSEGMQRPDAGPGLLDAAMRLVRHPDRVAA
ncbi:MAG: tRNA dihydrouridine(20/20a) synthase DusA [Geminicoccaceae bacterium]